MNFTWDLTNFTQALPAVGPGVVAPPLYINCLCTQVLLESLQKSHFIWHGTMQGHRQVWGSLSSCMESTLPMCCVLCTPPSMGSSES